ncbi:hypothetical protein BST61_g1988 [Cercospora zeina]
MASPIMDKRDAASDFLDLLADPFAAALAGESALASLITSIVLTAVLGLLFCFLRPYNSVVYATRAKYADSKHMPPPIGKGLFGWVKPLVQTKEPDLVRTVGLDAAVFMRVVRMLRAIFTVLAVIGCGILIPVNVISSRTFLEKNGWSTGIFYLMTPQYMVGNQRLWLYVATAWTFDVVVCYFLWRNYRAITRMRRQYFESEEYQRSLHARTLMLTDIPKDMRTDEGIARITDKVKTTPDMPKTSIARNVKDLPHLVKQHEKCVRELEEHLAKYLKNPDRLPATRPTCKPHKEDRSFGSYAKGQKVDAIEYLAERIKGLEMEIREVRSSVDRRNAMSYGFASYEQISSAHSVAYAAGGKKHQGAFVHLAPKPNSIIWKNMNMLQAQRKRRDFVNGMWIVVLTLVWVVPNLMIAIFLSNLANLGRLWPAFQTSLQAHRTWWAIVQGVAAPAITTAFYFYLPSIFRKLCIKAGDITKSSRERHVFRNLYSFFLFNNLIVFSLFASIWQLVVGIIQGESYAEVQPFQKIVVGLCQVSPYWISWMLQRNLGAAVDLSQLWTLIWGSYSRRFLSPTPRALIELSAPQAFDYAAYYNYFLFYATVALTFAVLQPLILPVAALYFWIDSYMKKYLLMYVFITKYESGGMFWRSLFNRILFMTFFGNVIVALILAAFSFVDVNWPMLAALAPLPLLLMGFKVYCKKTFDDDIHYYTTGRGSQANEAALVDGKKRKGDRSQHLLKQIYKGRTSIDEPVETGGYSDINMDSMSVLRLGKKKQDRNSFGWEVVDENNMDFEHYKNRPEFRDEAGGDGELYGRAGDMVRPGTPSSIATGLTRVGDWDSDHGHSREASGNSDYYHDRSGSQSRDTSRTRVPEAGYAMPAGYHQTPSNLRGESPMGRPLGNPPRSRDPSREGLVQHSAQMGASTPGGDMGYGPVRYGHMPGDTPGYDSNEENTSYDYFRRGRN